MPPPQSLGNSEGSWSIAQIIESMYCQVELAQVHPTSAGPVRGELLVPHLTGEDVQDLVRQDGRRMELDIGVQPRSELPGDEGLARIRHEQRNDQPRVDNHHRLRRPLTDVLPRRMQ